LRLENHPDGNVVDPCLVPQNQALQGVTIAVLGSAGEISLSHTGVALLSMWH